MSRTQFGDGQEITHDDLNSVSATVEKTVLDLLLPQLTKGQENKIFGAGLVISRVNATTLQAAAGLGIQTSAGALEREPQKRLINNKAPKNLGIEVPHPVYDRVDLVCVRSSFENGLTGVRRYKDFNSDNYTNQEFVLEKDWASEFQVVMGIEDGSKAVPAVPDGYLPLAEVTVTAINGIQNEAAIKDRRSRFSHLKYDAVVGPHAYCTHTTLALALADENVVEGSEILVLADQLVTSPIVISKANIEIEFAPKVTFSKGGAATKALSIQANGVRITKGRFSGFNGGADAAIEVAAGTSHTLLFAQRYVGNTKTVNDLGNNTTILGEIAE